MYSLKELAKSKDKRVADKAKKLLEYNHFPETAKFEICIRQVIITSTGQHLI